MCQYLASKKSVAADGTEMTSALNVKTTLTGRS